MSYSALWNAFSVRTKLILSGIVTIAGLITGVPQVRDFVLLTFHNHPDLGTWIMAAAAAITSVMSPHSDAGAVVHAKEILAQPDAPTTAQINAASTKP